MLFSKKQTLIIPSKDHSSMISSADFRLISESENKRLSVIRESLRAKTVTQTKLSKKDRDPNTGNFSRSIIIDGDKAYALFTGKLDLMAIGRGTRTKLAQDIDTGEWVAIKVLNPDNFPNRGVVTSKIMIDTEAGALLKAGLLHSHIQKLQNTSNNNNKHYFLTKLINGMPSGTDLFRVLYGEEYSAKSLLHSESKSKARYFKRNGLPLSFSLNIAISLVEDLMSFHEKGILLRHISSNEVSVDVPSQTAKFSDLNKALVLEKDETESEYQFMKRSMPDGWMLAPELSIPEQITPGVNKAFYLSHGFTVDDYEKSSSNLNPWPAMSFQDFKNMENIYNWAEHENAETAFLRNYNEYWDRYLEYETFFPCIYRHILSYPYNQNKEEVFLIQEAASLTTTIIEKRFNMTRPSIINENEAYSEVFEENLRNLKTQNYVSDNLDGNLNALFKPAEKDALLSDLEKLGSKVNYILTDLNVPYSEYSDIYGLGRLFAEIFSDNDLEYRKSLYASEDNYSSKPNLSVYSDVLHPNKNIPFELFSIYNIIRQMLASNPKDRISLGDAKKQLIEIKNTLEQEPNALALREALQTMHQHFSNYHKIHTKSLNPFNRFSFHSKVRTDEGALINPIQFKCNIALEAIRHLENCNFHDKLLLTNDELITLISNLNELFIKNEETFPKAENDKRKVDGLNSYLSQTLALLKSECFNRQLNIEPELPPLALRVQNRRD